MVRLSHPPDDRLLDFGLGRASEDESGVVERHLAECETCRSFVETAADDAFVRLVRDTLPPPRGSSDGRASTRAEYRDLRFFAKGGLGEVSLARDDAVGRDVAVKRMLPHGEGTPALRSRFLREARITGRLEHPGIVPVYGVGEDESGRPCYAMRYVPGETLADAIAALHANGPVTDAALRPLLARFVSLCSTAAYAHSRGVVHRDIKPNNVAVGSFGETILLDWGLAQADDESELVARHSDDTPSPSSVHTQTGAVLGTPGYMAPEQAAGGRVGPAADQYALGATLRTLLTGRGPNREPNPSAAPRPLLAVAAKAMSPSPSDRYASALDLARDVERWLADEPVAAARDPWATRVRRFVRRHQTAAAATVMLLAASTMALAIGNVMLDREQRKTLTALDDRRTALSAEEDQRKKAEAKEVETAAVLKFVVSRIFSAGRPKGRDGGLGRDVKMADAVAAAVPFVEKSFNEQPLTEARLRTTLGQSYSYLSDPANAVEQFAAARALYARELGPEHPDTLTSVSNLAAGYRNLGRTEDALRLDEDVLARRRIVLGVDHRDTLRSMHNLANLYADLDRNADALKLDEEVYATRRATLGPDHADTLWSMDSLAVGYAAVGRKHDALKLSEDLVPLLSAKFGPDHPDTLNGMNNLANRYHDLGRHDESLRIRTDVLRRYQTVNGPNHTDTLTAMSNLARSYGATKDFAEALRLHREVLALRLAHLKPDHADSLLSRYNVAVTLVDMGRGDEAIPQIDDLVRRSAGKIINPQIVPAVMEKRLRHFAGKADATGCQETATIWEDLKRTDPASLLLAARMRAVASHVTASSQPTDRTLAKQDQDRAFAWLKRATATGSIDPKTLANDKDFEILRTHPDYPTVVGLGPLREK